jgi:hypothetical protein
VGVDVGDKVMVGERVAVLVTVGDKVIVRVLVTMDVEVFVAVTVWVNVGVPVNPPALVGVDVEAGGAVGKDTLLELHPTIETIANNVIALKQPISFFTFTSPLANFWFTTTAHGCQARV